MAPLRVGFLAAAAGALAWGPSAAETDVARGDASEPLAGSERDVAPPPRAAQLAKLRASSPRGWGPWRGSRGDGEAFDLLVIGGGATGCGIALDAATRGLRVALVEKGDFAGGTSSRSTKLAHGGVRYLEKAVKGLDFGQV